MAAAAVASIGGHEEQILGTSTADQVLERWNAFLVSSARTLRERAPQPGEGHRLPPCSPPAAPSGGAATGDEVSPPCAVQDALRLSDSSAGRVATALGTALHEARACTALACETYRRLSVFGEATRRPPGAGRTAQPPAEQVLELAEALPCLRRSAALLGRVAALAEHLLRQLVGLHAAGAGAGAATGGNQLRGFEQLPPLRPVVDALGELLLIPVTMDALVQENPHLRRAFESYSWIVQKSGDRPEGLLGGGLPELPGEAAAALGAQLRDVEPIVAGSAFKTCAERVAAALQGLGPEASVAVVRDRLGAHFRARLEAPDSAGPPVAAGGAAAAAGPTSASQLLLPSESLLPWVCAFALVAVVWRRSDRLAADIWKARRRSPVVVVQGQVAWCLGDFLRSHFPVLAAGEGGAPPEDLEALRKRQAARLDEGGFAQEMQRCRLAVMTWLTRLGATSRALSAGDVAHALRDAHSSLLRGLALALRVRTALEEYLVLHVRKGVPIPRSCLPSVSTGFQLLKAIEAGPSTPRWAELAVLLRRHLTLRLHTELQGALTQLRQQRRGSTGGGTGSQERAATSALKVAIAALYRIVGGAPEEHLEAYFDAGALALAFAGRDGEAADGNLASRWKELRLLCQWQSRLTRLCDTSWCYWLRELLPLLLQDLRERPRALAGLPDLCRAFAAPLAGLLGPPPPGSADAEGGPEGSVAGSGRLADSYSEELKRALEEKVVGPLCLMVEQDLRLHSHAGANAADAGSQLLPTRGPTQEAMELLSLRPLPLGPRALLDLKEQVEQRLSKTFYDLTALAPQDAAAYTRMRVLAEERYGLVVLDGRLPGGSLDHGLDVIELMRNIHVLAAQYCYNMHEQIFAQAVNQGDNKIHIVTLQHLATSIQIHGTGVISTTVNYTYGFLRRQLEIVVEFLADEGVRSRMLSDGQWLENQRRQQESGRCGYTWARAADTVKHLRRLGTTKDGTTFLDKFRQVVTQIGNSLGYIRMVRNAGIRSAAKSLPYIEAFGGGGPSQPRVRVDGAEADASLPAGPGLLLAAKSAGCPPPVEEAAEAADEAIRSVRRCFEAATDHLKVLVEVFRRALDPGCLGARSSESTGLFHLLVPALCVSFLDSLLVGQDTLAKRAAAPTSGPRDNAFCFDDGFALGTACILRILGLERRFQALHWFETQIADGDAAIGQARAATVGGALHDQPRSVATSRREALERELARLAAAIEAGSALLAPARERREDADQASPPRSPGGASAPGPGVDTAGP